MTYARYTRFLSITTSASIRGLRMQNEACSKISGVPLDLDLHEKGRTLTERAQQLRARVERKYNYDPTVISRVEGPTAYEIACGEAPSEPHDVTLCICERAYRGDATGVAHIDGWLFDSLRDWPNDWYAQVYHGRFADSDDFDHELGQKIKNRIEANCQTPIHYPTLLADDQYGGRPVYTSLDPEKQEENRERSEDALWLSTNPWEQRKLVEYRGDDADLIDGAKTSDALSQQRRPDQDEKEETPVPTQLRFDATQAEATASRAEYKALGRIAKEEPSAWDKQVWANKRRIRAKEEQARRDLWFIVKRETWSDDPEKIEDIQRRVKEHGYQATLKVIREGFRVLAAA